MSTNYFCLLSTCHYSSARSNNLYRHVQTVHSHLFREPHTFACCDTTFSAAGVLFKHLVSRHKDQHLVLVERNGVLHLQPFSTLRRNREMLPKGPDAVEEDDSLDNTPSLHEPSGMDTLSNGLEGLESLPPFATNEDNVEVNPPSMPADFDFFIDMEVEVEEGVEETAEASESDVDMEAALAMDILSGESVYGDEEEEVGTIMGLDTIANADQELVRDYYLFLSEHTTVKTYARFVKYRVGRMDSNWLPKSFDTLRTRAHRIIGVPLNPVELVDSTIPIIRLKRMISYWMASRVHSLAIKKTNDTTCGILDGTTLPLRDVHGPMWASELWASTARSAMPESSPIVSLPIVYLHVIVHVDDYKPYDRSSMLYTMVAISLGEFDTGQRADRSNSFLIPYTIFRKEASPASTAFTEMDKVTQLLDTEFHELFQEGEFVVHSAAHGGPVLVRAFPYLIVGDSVARAQFTGVRQPSPMGRTRCFICGLGWEGRVHGDFWAEEAQYRDLDEARRIYALVQANGSLADRSEPLYRASSVWNWPNFDPIRQQGIDIMHLEGIGLLHAHIELLEFTKEEFQRISAQTKSLSRQLGGKFTTSISTFGQFKQLTARNKFFFALLSPITFSLCLSSERLDGLVFRAWWNHLAYMVILTKYVISSEELEKAKREARLCWSALIQYSRINPNRPNIHLLIHQFGNILNFGVPRGYWCFPFESMIQGLRFIETRNSNRKSSNVLILKRQWELCLLESYLQQAAYLKPIYAFDRGSGRIACVPLKLPKRTIIAYVSSIDSNEELFGLVLRVFEDHFVVAKLRVSELTVQGVPGYHRFPYQETNGQEIAEVPRKCVVAYFYAISSPGHLLSVPHNF